MSNINPITRVIKPDNTQVPVSPAYKDPDVDYPFEYEASPTDAGSLVIHIYAQGTTTDVPGSPNTLPLYYLTSHEFTQAELSNITAKVTEPDSIIPNTIFAEDPFVADMNALASAFLFSQNITLTDTITGLPGNTASLSPGLRAYTVLSLSTAYPSGSEFVSSTFAGEVSGTPVDVVIEIMAPAAGSYLMSAYNNIVSGVSGVISVAKYNFDPRFCPGQIIHINNSVLSMLMSQGPVSLNTYFPTIFRKAVYSMNMGVPVQLTSGPVSVISLQSVYDESNNTYSWMFRNGSSSVLQIRLYRSAGTIEHVQ